MFWVNHPQAPVEFVCKHCEKVQVQEHGRLIICTCPGSLKEQSEERQRIENWRKQQEAALNTSRRKR